MAKYRCEARKCRYGDEKQPERNFWTNSKVEAFKHRNGKYIYCKECMKDMFYSRLEEGRILTDDLQKFQKSIDQPFNIKYLNSAMNAKQDTLGLYFSMFSGRGKNKIGWENSVFSTDAEENRKISDRHNGLSKYDEMRAHKDYIEVIPMVFKKRELLQEMFGDYCDKDLVRFCKLYFKYKPTADIRDGRDEQTLITACISQGLANKAKEENKEKVNDIKHRANIARQDLAKVKTINGSGRADALTKLMELVEKEKGTLDFIDKNYTEYNRDLVDETMRINQVLAKKNFGTGDPEIDDIDYHKTYDFMREALANSGKNLKNRDLSLRQIRQIANGDNSEEDDNE